MGPSTVLKCVPNVWCGAAVFLFLLVPNNPAHAAIPNARGFWPLDSVNEGHDVSGNGNHAALYGVSYAEGPFGNSGGSLEFAGTSESYGTIENKGGLDVSPDMTWMAWVFDLSDGEGGYFGYADNTDGGRWSLLFWDCCSGAQKFLVDYYKRGTGEAYGSHHELFTSKTDWVHVATTFDNTAGKIYVYKNGILDDRYTKNVTGAGLDTTHDVYMGKTTMMADSRYLNARMACMQLYNVPLTGDQIKEAIEKCKPAPVTIPKPKGFWMLDRQNQGKDLSGYGNDIFLHQTKNAVGPYGAEGGSMEFEGTSGSYGTITNNGALDVAVDMTWMVWFYDLSTGQGPLFIYAPSIGGTHWSTIFFDCCTVESSFHPVFTKRGSTVRYPDTGTIPSTLGLDDSAWIHLAVTFNNTAGKVYVYRNGILDTRFTQSFTGGDGIDTAGDISIGKVMYKSDDRYLNARMACMQLYGETLSQEQILAAMEKCKTKPVEKQPTRYAVEATSCSVNEYLTTPNTLTPRMTAFTICYWLRVYKHTSNPHVFMVWNSGVTNALIMVVKDASYTLIINSATANLAVDGYSTVDGNWHRECWVWDSDTGIYAMYHLENSGVWQKAGEVTDFKKGATIEEGYLTLLQDQDSMLGGFQSNACFYGIMAGMEWWSYAKSSADIDALGCLERGNVWSMTAATVKAVGSFDGQFELAVCCRGLRKSSTPASKRDPSISQGTYHITKGKKSASLPDSTTANVTAEECIQSCLGTESCDTVNYVPSVRTCQLNSDGGNGVSGVTEDASSDYYTEWYQMTETESTLCPSLT